MRSATSMFKRYSLPGTAPATLTPRTPGPAVPPELAIVEYGEEFYEEHKLTSIKEVSRDCPHGHFRWIEMNGLGDVDALRQLGVTFGLHPLALEDVLNTGQRPKVDAYPNHLFVVTQMTYRDKEGQLSIEQVSLFLLPGVLITIQEEPDSDVFAPVRERLRAGASLIRKLGSDYLAYALLDAIIDHVFPLLEAISTGVEELEDTVMERPSKDCPARLHEYKRMLMHLRRLAWPQRDVISALLHDESGVIGKDTKVFLRDCYDHTVQIMDLIESYRDVISGLLEMYLSVVGMRTNEIMRVLTVISSIFIPLTFVAGLYGMNFAHEANGKELPLNMPELYQPHGYVVCLAIMGVIAIFQVIFFRRKGWL